VLVHTKASIELNHPRTLIASLRQRALNLFLSIPLAIALFLHCLIINIVRASPRELRQCDVINNINSTLISTLLTIKISLLSFQNIRREEETLQCLREWCTECLKNGKRGFD
jgi:hypothetical protein